MYLKNMLHNLNEFDWPNLLFIKFFNFYNLLEKQFRIVSYVKTRYTVFRDFLNKHKYFKNIFTFV